MNKEVKNGQLSITDRKTRDVYIYVDIIDEKLIFFNMSMNPLLHSKTDHFLQAWSETRAVAGQVFLLFFLICV